MFVEVFVMRIFPFQLGAAENESVTGCVGEDVVPTPEVVPRKNGTLIEMNIAGPLPGFPLHVGCAVWLCNPLIDTAAGLAPAPAS